MRALTLSLLIGLAVATPTLAAGDIREERVRFKAGTSQATLKGHLRGDSDVDYLLGAKAGQRMSLELDSDNPQNYFNVLPPGNDEAIFVGSSSGNRFEGTLRHSGDYRVRVYLMRPAARRNEQAHYRLKVHIGDAQPSHSPSYSHSQPQSHNPDFADGLAGGPDFWEVAGVVAGDILNLRAGPSAHERVLGELGNGSILRNLGCKMADGQRWCRVARPEDTRSEGWVAGRYLRESSYQP